MSQETLVAEKEIKEEAVVIDTTNEPKNADMERYVYMEKSLALLEIGFKTSTNVIQYGPGGHGKSDLSIDFLASKGITNPHVQTMGNGTTTDTLFGGLNLKVFNEEGKIEYLVENSWMNHEYVIFEELFDAPDYILEQLKDILSSGVFRNGSQRFEIKTKLIICNTNRTREEFIKNASLAALMERFPLELEVRWKDYNDTTYTNLLQKTLGTADPLLVYVLDKFAKENKIISPRIAIKAAMLIKDCGPDCLEFIADFQKDTKLLSKSIKAFKAAHQLQIKSSDLIQKLDELSKVDVTTLNNKEDFDALDVKIKELEDFYKELEALKVDEADAAKKAQVINAAKDYLTKTEKALALLK